jgi:hypothetical protein
MSLEGTVKNGMIVLDPPGVLPEVARVEVTLKEAAAPTPAQGPTLLGLVKLAGSLDDLPADFAAEHDHYIYGTPRRHRRTADAHRIR